MAASTRRREAHPMTAVQAHAEIAALAREIGAEADVSLSISAGRYDRSDKPVYASIYTQSLGRGNGPDFACYGRDLAEVVAALRTGWEEFQVEHSRRVTADMALEIIRITDEMGECSDAALRGSKFGVGDIARYGTAACAKANEMAGRGPFSIVTIAGANGRAA